MSVHIPSDPGFIKRLGGYRVRELQYDYFDMQKAAEKEGIKNGPRLRGKRMHEKKMPSRYNTGFHRTLEGGAVLPPPAIPASLTPEKWRMT